LNSTEAGDFQLVPRQNIASRGVGIEVTSKTVDSPIGNDALQLFRFACRYWYLSLFSVKLPGIEGCPQYIVIINHPGHYMKIYELELPQHLFTEETSPCGTLTRLIAPDKLVSWAEEGRGDAVARLCHSVYERKLESIDAWESDRILQLEDEWKVAGNDEGMSGCKYENVKHYHTTREDVAREAELKRASVKEGMTEHQAAIEELVQEARGFISAYVAQHDDGDMLAYLLAIVVILVAGYALFN